MTVPKALQDSLRISLSTAILGVPVVLWLGFAHLKASEADTRSRANAFAIQRLDKQQGRIEEMLRAIKEDVVEIKQAVK